MLDTKKMSVEQIKDHIMDQYKIPLSQIANIKGKSNIVNFLLSLQKQKNSNSIDKIYKEEFNELKEIGWTENNDTDLDGQMIFTDVIAGVGYQTDNEQVNITPTNPRWSSYILGLLSDDEKDRGYPKSDGLRRLVEEKISPIIAIETNVVQAPQTGNNMTATVKTTIFLENGTKVDACADAQKEHCPTPYDQHLSAIAETRAEGRAYRKILRLKNTATHEEMTSKEDHTDHERIVPSQKKMINVLCRNDKLNINVQKLFDNYFKEDKLPEISQYTYNQGIKICELLSDYQADMSKIPQEIMGYDPTWLN